MYKFLGRLPDFAFWPFRKYGHLFKNLVETINMEMLRLMPLGASATFNVSFRGMAHRPKALVTILFPKCHASYRNEWARLFK